MTTRSHVLAWSTGASAGLIVGLIYGSFHHDLDLMPRRRK